MIKMRLVSNIIDEPFFHDFLIGFCDYGDQEVKKDDLHQQLVNYKQYPYYGNHCY